MGYCLYGELFVCVAVSLFTLPSDHPKMGGIRRVTGNASSLNDDGHCPPGQSSGMRRGTGQVDGLVPHQPR